MNKTVYILLLIFFTSCTKEISFDPGGHESKLVVNSFFSPYGFVSVNISKSIPILAADSLNYIDNAEIELFENGVLIGRSNYNQKGFYTIPAILMQKQKYTISVSVPGMETVSSCDSIPVQVPILSLDTISIDSKYLYCEIKFQDVAEMSDYYLLELATKHPFKKSDSIFSNQVDIIVIDNIVENGNAGDLLKRICFSDERIQGNVYELSFIIDKEPLLNSLNAGSNTIYINFKTISKDYYTYVKTYYDSQKRQIDVYTNIVDGYGIFAGYNIYQDSIFFQRGW